MSFAPPESKSKDDGPSLLCSVEGCRNLWSVRLEGALPKCSHHQWQQPKYGNTKTYQQHLADKNKPTDKTVSAWYDKGQR